MNNVNWSSSYYLFKSCKQNVKRWLNYFTIRMGSAAYASLYTDSCNKIAATQRMKNKTYIWIKCTFRTVKMIHNNYYTTLRWEVRFLPSLATKQSVRTSPSTRALLTSRNAKRSASKQKRLLQRSNEIARTNRGGINVETCTKSTCLHLQWTSNKCQKQNKKSQRF